MVQGLVFRVQGLGLIGFIGLIGFRVYGPGFSV